MPMTTREQNEEPMTFEQIREMFREIGRKQEETDRLIMENGKQMGYLSNRYGEIAEHQILPNLKASFNALGFKFGDAFHPPRSRFQEPALGLFTEVDACLENGDSVMIVELKTDLKIEHIDYHVKRMERIRAIVDYRSTQRFADRRKYYGAIAGLLMSESEKTYALKKGFYVLEPIGEHFTITIPEGPGMPGVW
jgi:hypothetical protein